MGFFSFFRKSQNVSVIPLNGIIAPNMGRRKGLNLNEIDNGKKRNILCSKTV